MNEVTYRIKIRQGDYEFDVSGDKEFVEGKYQELKLKPITPSMDRVAGTVVNDSAEIPATEEVDIPAAGGTEIKSLHEKLGIEKIQLDKILKLNGNSVLLIKHPDGSSKTQIQCNAILVISYVLKEGLGIQPLNSQDTALFMKHSGMDVESIRNAFTYLGNKRFLIREKVGSQLKILTLQGEEEARSIIKRLVDGV
jgi:hypothetical protein